MGTTAPCVRHALTCQQEGGAVGAKLAPEGAEEVDELEGAQATPGSQRFVGTSSDVEQYTNLQHNRDACTKK